MFEKKKKKLAQFGERVFNLTGDSTEDVAEKAIEKLVTFLEEMGMETKLSQAATNYDNTANFIVNRFEERGWKAMGEKQNITLDKVREIVEMSY